MFTDFLTIPTKKHAVVQLEAKRRLLVIVYRSGHVDFIYSSNSPYDIAKFWCKIDIGLSLFMEFGIQPQLIEDL